MKNISFMLTTEQIRNRTKTVTRRCGWRDLKPGDRLRACVKCMGLKRGEQVQVLAEIEIISNLKEPLAFITKEECIREGFPHMTPAQFIAMFIKAMKCTPDTIVQRIEFKYV